MRLARDIEVLHWLGRDEVMAITGVRRNTYYRWISGKKMSARNRTRIALSHPRELYADDDGVLWWIDDEPDYAPPDWVPRRWWDAYLHSRKINSQGVDEDDLMGVVRRLDDLREEGQDPGLVLRNAITQGLAVPVGVKEVTS